MNRTANREIWVDWMRVTACFMVMLTHCCEPFYLGGEGSLILTRSDALWVSVLNVLPRACVALFVVASSYLQFPLHYSTGEFFRRRAGRILIPFAFWSVVYALISADPAGSFKDLALNFNYSAGHMWFVYMLFGLYLLMPVLSPWAEKVSRKELRFYLGFCLLTTLIPFVRQWVGGPAPVIYGPTGIPSPARYPLWGEASWNAYGLFYYFSGFIGYMLLGLYFRRFVGEMSWRKTLAIAVPAFAAGFAICSTGFMHGVNADAQGTFPVEGPVGLAAIWEGMWLNDTFGVALMTVAWILVFRKFNTETAFCRKVLLPVSGASYGMYLSHMVILGFISAWLRGALGVGDAGVLGVWTTPVQMLSSAVLSFAAVAVVCVVVRRIPVVGKWIMG